MNLKIPNLQKNDLIYICSPAKAIEEEHVYYAKDLLENEGYKVQIGKHALGQFNYFSGTIEERVADLQYGIDNDEVKLILAARGGYGCVQLLDHLQWAGFVRNPKWLLGFSDVTFLHQKIQSLGFQSVHATMPLNFKQNTPESFATIWKACSDETYTIQCSNDSYNQLGSASGKLIGGNFSILSSMIGTSDLSFFDEAILFIEDVGEYLYHLDRMLHSFAKANLLEKINGLVVGGMTDLKDTPMGFGINYQEIILSHFKYRKIPIAFNFPAGHINDNRALRLGAECLLEVKEQETSLKMD